MISADPKLIPMPQRTREMMLRIWDGHPEALPLLHQIFGLPMRDSIFEWLIKSHLTGSFFIAWFRLECEGSPMFMAATLKNRVGGPRVKLVREERET